MHIILHIGRYFILMKRVFRKPEKFSVYFRQFIEEIDKIGIQSLGILVIISAFMGFVIAIQTAFNITNPLTPLYLVGFTARQSIVLEFSSTLLSLILAGKVGSRIASEIGTMRITEQIDALETMGVNSASYLILPKIIASLFIFPFLSIIAMFIGIIASYFAAVYISDVPANDIIYGLKLDFRIYDITYSMIKTLFFAFALTSISAYEGYYAYGGALDVGKASTKAVVYSSIAILILNYIITQILLG